MGVVLAVSGGNKVNLRLCLKFYNTHKSSQTHSRNGNCQHGAALQAVSSARLVFD